MVPKQYIPPQQLVRDSFALARRIVDSGYRPDALLVLWRGGTPVGIVIHEFLLYKGIDAYHTVVKATSYNGIERRSEPVIENLDHVMAAIMPNSNVLVIDDIFDSGRTLQKVCRHLGAITPHVRTATLYVRDGHNETDLEPDFFHSTTDQWIVFPHELIGLTLEDIRSKDPYIHGVVTQQNKRETQE